MIAARALTLANRTRHFLFLGAAGGTLLLAACGGADTAADKVDTSGVTAVGSGTGAGDSANAGARPTGSLMGDSITRDSILGDSAGHDTLNRRKP